MILMPIIMEYKRGLITNITSLFGNAHSFSKYKANCPNFKSILQPTKCSYAAFGSRGKGTAVCVSG